MKSWLPKPEVFEIPSLFLTNVKFPWPTELEISQISPDNGLIVPLPVIPYTYLFMLLTSHFQYT